MRVRQVVCIAFSLMLGAAPVAAQQVARPMTIIVPFTPGNALDAVARLLAAGYEQQYGQKTLVENRPGTGTYAGSAYVARSAPDGQTLLMNVFAGLDVSVFVKDLEVDLSKSLTPLAVVAVGPAFLLGSATLPVKNLSEFVAYAKKNPGKLNVASLGNTTDLLNTLSFLRAAGIEMVHVPYNALPVSALLTGEAHLFWNTVGAWVPHIKSGKVIALAVVTAERSELLPEVPTIKEQGVDFAAPPAIFCIFGPVGIGNEVKERLNKQLYGAAMRDAAFAEGLKVRGLSLPKKAEGLDQLSAQLAQHATAVRDTAARFGIKAQ